MLKRLLIPLAVLALAGFALAACGGGDDASSTAPATPSGSTSGEGGDEDAPAAAAGDGGDATVDISADPSGALAFANTALTTTAGSDTIKFDNESSTGHNVYVEDADGNNVAEIETITGSSATTVADLKPGTYTFYCNIPGHRDAGMEGTITVK